MRHSWDEAKPPAAKHPADIVAQGRASGRGAGVPSSARTRSGCRETLTSVARDPLSPPHFLEVRYGYIGSHEGTSNSMSVPSTRITTAVVRRNWEHLLFGTKR